MDFDVVIAGGGFAGAYCGRALGRALGRAEGVRRVALVAERNVLVFQPMLAEVAGKAEANRLVSAKLKDIKAALQAAVAKSKDWCPGWMRFPAKGL